MSISSGKLILRSHLKRNSSQHRLLPTFFSPSRSLAQVRSNLELSSPNPDLSITRPANDHFSPNGYGSGSGSDARADERTLKLGNTLSILQDHLPTLLVSPLPQEILSPSITLHLFPSTHPHLPTVTGRVAYHAALWTSPVAWGSVPLLGNVRLVILSERVVKNGGSRADYLQDRSLAEEERQTPRNASIPSISSSPEKLIVRWKTSGKTKGLGMGALYRGISGRVPVDKITEWLGGDARDDEEFCGIFVFAFDAEGRVKSHMIERAEEGRGWDGAGRVVTLAEWLLGKLGAGKVNGGLAFYEGKEKRIGSQEPGHA